MKFSAPPLHVWGLFLGFFIIILIPFTQMNFFGEYCLGPQFKEFQYRWSAFHEGLERDPDACLVLFVGSSFTAQAIPHGPYFDQQFEDDPGLNLQVRKIYLKQLNSSNSYRADSFFTAISSLKPDVLILEDAMMVYGSPKKIPFFLRRINQNVNSIKNKYFGTPLQKRKAFKKGFDDFTNFQKRLKEPLDTINRFGKYKINVLTLRESQIMRKTLTSLAKGGTKMVLLNVPKPDKIQRQFESPENREKLAHLLAYYNSNFPMTYWDFEQSLPFSAFHDAAHMNAKGRAIYRNWLVDQLQAKYGELCPN